MNSSNDLQVVGQNGVITKNICTQKRFKMGDSTWNYQNTIGLTLLNEDGSTKLKIKNHLCEMTGNKIKKVTEIIFKKKKYIIEDHYSLHLSQLLNQVLLNQKNQDQKDPNMTNDSQNKSKAKEKSEDKKTYIFAKRKHRKNGQHPAENLRNTKNISKNFCKAFQVFLRSDKLPERDPQQVRTGIQEYKKMLPERRYNNKAIKKIIGNETLRDLFRFFLQKEAKNWISESKINDKSLHQEAISIYLNLFERMHIEQDFSDSSIEDSQSGEMQFKQE